MTMLYRRVTLVSRFRSGRFPSADALRDVQSLTMEEVAKFHPDGLRKTYAPCERFSPFQSIDPMLSLTILYRREDRKLRQYTMQQT